MNVSRWFFKWHLTKIFLFVFFFGQRQKLHVSPLDPILCPCKTLSLGTISAFRPNIATLKVKILILPTISAWHIQCMIDWPVLTALCSCTSPVFFLLKADQIIMLFVWFFAELVPPYVQKLIMRSLYFMNILVLSVHQPAGPNSLWFGFGLHLIGHKVSSGFKT